MAHNMTPTQHDTLTELINIGVGRAANTLNIMLGKQVQLRVPQVFALTMPDLKEQLDAFGRAKLSSVRLSFHGAFSGATSLIFPPDSALKLVESLIEDDYEADDMDSLRIGTLTEIGNIVINNVMGSIANLLEKHLSYSLPDYQEETVLNIVSLNTVEPTATIILAHAQFDIQELQIDGNILLWFEVGSFDTLKHAIDDMNAGVA